MFQPGDVVRFQSPSAGKVKFHACVCASVDEDSYCFLFLNSEPRFPEELVYSDGTIRGLPTSRTGLTVVSFGMLVRMSSAKLSLFGAQRVSSLPDFVIDEIREMAAASKTLASNDKRRILDGLEPDF